MPWNAWHRILPVFCPQQQPEEFDLNIDKERENNQITNQMIAISCQV